MSSEVEAELERDDRSPPELVDDISRTRICRNCRSSGAGIDEVTTSGLAPG